MQGQLSIEIKELYKSSRPEDDVILNFIINHQLVQKVFQNFGILNLVSCLNLQDLKLLVQALTHTSFQHELNHWSFGNNEKLEFLGDAVLDCFISEKLFLKFPNLSEGDLSKLRASLVNSNHLFEWANCFSLSEIILIGSGESQKKGLEEAIVADAFEAFIGALYRIDKNKCQVVIETWPSVYDEQSKEDLKFFDQERLDFFDPKTKLQEISLKHFKVPPKYESQSFENDFETQVFINGINLGKGIGKSKKKAEMQAAKNILKNKSYLSII